MSIGRDFNRSHRCKNNKKKSLSELGWSRVFLHCMVQPRAKLPRVVDHIYQSVTAGFLIVGFFGV